MNNVHDTLYREIILEHWKNPLNYGVIINATIDITDNNPLCGDSIRITANFSKDNLTEIKFTSEGCAISKASASIYTEMIKNKSIEKLTLITEHAILNELGVSLTPARKKCALLAYRTFLKAIKS